MYYLVISFSLKRKRAIALVASIFYMFSPWIFNYLGIFVFLPYSVMPLILALFIRGISEKMNLIKSIFLIVLSLFGVVINLPQYSMYFVAVLLLALYTMFHLFASRGNFWRSFKFVLLLVFLVFLTSLWFILPYLSFFSFSGALDEIKNVAKVSGSIYGFGDFGYATILHLLRMFGAAAFMVGGTTYTHPYLDSPLLIFISYFFPILVFGAILFKPRSKSVLFFSIVAVVFIFLAKGVNAPFGKLHFWLVTHFSLARAFRTTWNLSLGANIAYAFLIGVSAVEIAVRLASKKAKNFVKVILIIVALIFVNAWPLLTGRYFQYKWNPPTFNGVKIPSAYYNLENYLAKDKIDSRFFKIPASEGTIRTNWGYLGSNFYFTMFSTPFINGYLYPVGVGKIAKNIYESIGSQYRTKESTLRALSLLNVGRIIYDGYDKTFKAKVKGDRLFLPGFKFENSFGKFSVYHIEDPYLLPHFFIPKKLIFTNVDASNFDEIFKLPDYRIRSGIFSVDLDSSELKKVNTAREILIKARPSVSVSFENKKEQSLSSLNLNSVYFPYVKWRPGSLFYPLVLEKEKLNMKLSSKDPESLVDRNLFFASKRIMELERWMPVLGKVEQQNVISRYRQLLGRAFSELEKVRRQGNGRLYIKLLAKIKTSVLAHRRKVNFTLSAYHNDPEKKVIVDELFGQIDSKLETLTELPDLFNISYYFYVSRKGNYDLFWEKNSDFWNKILSEDAELRIDHKNISINNVDFKNGAAIIKKKINLEKGNHQLKILFKERKNLLSTGKWQTKFSPYIKEAVIWGVGENYLTAFVNIDFGNVGKWAKGILDLSPG